MAFVLLSVAINLVLTFAFSITRERAVVSVVDTRLVEMAATLRELVATEGVGALASERIRAAADPRLAGQSWFMEVRDASGNEIARTGTVDPGTSMSALWNGRKDEAPGTTRTMHESLRTQQLPTGSDPVIGHGPARARVVVMDLASNATDVAGGPAQSTSSLIVGISMARADQMTREIERVLLWTAAGSTIASGLAGWIVSNGFTRRLRRVGDALNSVTPSDFTRGLRLPASTDELGELAVSLNTMLSGLERAFKGQERFLSDVSHELKTPLAALLTEAQVLHSGEATIDDYRAFVASTEDEARRLGKLVESFLMLVRFEHGRRFVAEALVPINDVAIDAMRHTHTLAHQRQVKVMFSAYDPGEERNEGLVRGDAELLRVAIENVVRNAVQVSKTGDAVAMEVTCIERRTMRIDVRDRGPGLKPDYINRVFSRFEHVPGRESGSRGTGLGLAIAKGIIDLHHGRLHAESHPEGGSVFRIELALADPKPETPNEPPVASRATGSAERSVA